MRKLLFAVVLFLITVVSGINIYFSYQIKYVVDALTTKNEQLFYNQIIYLSVIIILMLIYEYLRQILDTIYLNKVGFNIHRTLVGSLLSNKLDTKSKNLLSTVNNDIEMVKDQYYNTIFSLYQGIVYFIFATIALFKLDVTTAFWVIGLSLFPIVIPNLFKSYLKNVQNSISIQKASYNDKLEDFLEGLLVIKNSDSVNIFYEKLLNEYKKINKLVNRKNVLASLVNVLTGLVFYATIIAILYIGGRQALLGNTSVGDIVSIFTISAELVMPVNLITASIANITSVKDIKRELDSKEKFEYIDSHKTIDFENIEVRNESFKFNNREIFSDFSAIFEKGKKYLIQGDSGSGKSTLALLLTKNLEGCNIFLNGKNINSYEYNIIQKLITYVPQDSFIFVGKVIDNLTFYKNIEADKIMTLIKETRLDNKIKEASDLINTMYDKRKSNLSGGQKQRLALIRAILQEKQVIVLDETLSGLDKDTYILVEKLLLSMKDKTLIHISHRSYPETLKMYDEVYVMGSESKVPNFKKSLHEHS